MAVFYTLYQNNHEGFVNKGKWYACLYELNGMRGMRFLVSMPEFKEWGRGNGSGVSNP